ncbi:zinc carboxypeptidase domain-containing protein [Ditylenchus destructor]|uniref:Zinc carboxypeptidase domain-containing protein n=1 Tax=Ditylenchus destructor TaxID=166010 RepID=A0AAD4MLH1_9BILA|nr:zinc carboxypeptidase domain-containing protein [Ditylenchus destructor]
MPLIDVWSVRNAFPPTMDVLVAPDYADRFVNDLSKRGVKQIKLLKNDVQRDILREKRRCRRKRELAAPSEASLSKKLFSLDMYNRYGDIVSYLRELSAFSPNHTEFLNIGKSFEGRDLVGIKISGAPLHEKRKTVPPIVFIDAGIHAREWIAPAVAIYIIDKLVKSTLNKSEESYRWLQTFDFVIFPVINPDGYEYSMTKDRFWRKTRSRNITNSKWCVGADANRNWGYRWGEAGANRSPCSNIYAGSRPFSEPEMVAIRDYITENLTDLKIYISLHSFGHFFLSPWGYTDEKPHNYADQKMAAKLAVEAIKNLTGTEYNYGSIAELMYPASGTSIDYMQGAGVPYIYGIELAPEDVDDNYGFTLPPEFIEASGQEMMIALSKITEYARIHKRI